MTNSDILHAYRRLYRTTLQAVHYSTPARYQIRDIIRTAFRTEQARYFDAQKVENTVKFLDTARQTNGLEHKILRNILFTSYWRGPYSKTDRPPPWLRGNTNVTAELRRNLYSHFDATLTLLNESMGLCLRCVPGEVSSRTMQTGEGNHSDVAAGEKTLRKHETQP